MDVFRSTPEEGKGCGTVLWSLLSENNVIKRSPPDLTLTTCPKFSSMFRLSIKSYSRALSWLKFQHLKHVKFWGSDIQTWFRKFKTLDGAPSAENSSSVELTFVRDLFAKYSQLKQNANIIIMNWMTWDACEIDVQNLKTHLESYGLSLVSLPILTECVWQRLFVKNKVYFTLFYS